MHEMLLGHFYFMKLFWDKLNLVQKKKMLNEIKIENFFNEFNDFINKAKR